MKITGKRGRKCSRSHFFPEAHFLFSKLVNILVPIGQASQNLVVFFLIVALSLSFLRSLFVK